MPVHGTLGYTELHYTITNSFLNFLWYNEEIIGKDPTPGWKFFAQFHIFPFIGACNNVVKAKPGKPSGHVNWEHGNVQKKTHVEQDAQNIQDTQNTQNTQNKYTQRFHVEGHAAKSTNLPDFFAAFVGQRSWHNVHLELRWQRLWKRFHDTSRILFFALLKHGESTQYFAYSCQKNRGSHHGSSGNFVHCKHVFLSLLYTNVCQWALLPPCRFQMLGTVRNHFAQRRQIKETMGVSEYKWSESPCFVVLVSVCFLSLFLSWCLPAFDLYLSLRLHRTIIVFLQTRTRFVSCKLYCCGIPPHGSSRLQTYLFCVFWKLCV